MKDGFFEELKRFRQVTLEERRAPARGRHVLPEDVGMVGKCAFKSVVHYCVIHELDVVLRKFS